MAEGLSSKQEDLLVMLGTEPDEPLTTFDLFNLAQTCHEDAEADTEAGYDRVYSWIGWDRGGIYATLRRLEDRGFVERCDPPQDRGIVIPVGPLDEAPKRQPARYAWQLTARGREVGA